MDPLLKQNKSRKGLRDMRVSNFVAVSSFQYSHPQSGSDHISHEEMAIIRFYISLMHNCLIKNTDGGCSDVRQVFFLFCSDGQDNSKLSERVIRYQAVKKCYKSFQHLSHRLQQRFLSWSVSGKSSSPLSSLESSAGSYRTFW